MPSPSCISFLYLPSEVVYVSTASTPLFDKSHHHLLSLTYIHALIPTPPPQIPVRIAGIDAPEGAHFGRPAQPHSGEALAFLREYLQGRRVRAYIYRRDQYERVVASVLVRQPPFFFPRRDVGLEMLKRGLATTYVAKTGAEFGGEASEKRYKAAEEEARRKGRGLWAAEKGGLFGLRKKEIESPRMYKDRMKAEGKNS